MLSKMTLKEDVLIQDELDETKAGMLGFECFVQAHLAKQDCEAMSPGNNTMAVVLYDGLRAGLGGSF